MLEICTDACFVAKDSENYYEESNSEKYIGSVNWHGAAVVVVSLNVDGHDHYSRRKDDKQELSKWK